MIIEPEPKDVAALLRLHLAGDAEAIDALMSMLDARALLPMTVGFLLAMLERAGVDAVELDAQLELWQAERRRVDGLG